MEKKIHSVFPKDIDKLIEYLCCLREYVSGSSPDDEIPICNGHSQRSYVIPINEEDFKKIINGVNSLENSMLCIGDADFD